MIDFQIDPNLTTTLCTRCGLCCDGSLFADVELARGDEASSMEAMGLDIEGGDEEGLDLLLQPCKALKGKRCSIYPHRPDCCRTFECRLLREAKGGIVSIDQAQERIALALTRIERVKQLLVQLGQGNERLPLKERCMEALTGSDEVDGDRASKRVRAELEAAMTAVESLIQKTFLGG